MVLRKVDEDIAMLSAGDMRTEMLYYLLYVVSRSTVCCYIAASRSAVPPFRTVTAIELLPTYIAPKVYPL